MPDDPLDTSPGPGYFFVPGQYVPDGDEVTWRRGFWSKSQPGWRWTPDRWVVGEEGWRFEPGRWASLAGGLGNRSAGGLAEADRARLPEAIDPAKLDPPPTSAENPAAGSSRTALRPATSAAFDRVDSGVSRAGALPPEVLTSVPRESAGSIPREAKGRTAPETRAAIPEPGPSAPLPTLLAWADRLADESAQFYQSFAAGGGTVPEAGSIFYEAQQLHLAALALRRAASGGADAREVLWVSQQAEAWWGRLAGRVQRLSGGRIGPNVGQVLAMSRTLAQVRAALPVVAATHGVVEPLPEAPAIPAGWSPPQYEYGAPPPYATMVPAPRRPASVGGMLRGVGGRLLRPR